MRLNKYRHMRTFFCAKAVEYSHMHIVIIDFYIHTHVCTYVSILSHAQADLTPAFMAQLMRMQSVGVLTHMQCV